MPSRSGVLLASNLLFLFIFNSPVSLRAQGTAFSYQGWLNAAGSPANGNYDLAFTLYPAVTNGIAVAGPVTNLLTPVSNGVFIAAVDFGQDIFTGGNYWLEVAVQTNGGGGFTTLAPRQPVMAAPYAIFAATASNFTGSISDSQLSVNIARLNGGANFARTVTANYFSGNGGGLTNLDGGNFTSQPANSILGNGSGSTAQPAFTTNGSYVANSIAAQNLSANGTVVISNTLTTSVPLQIYTNLNATNGGDAMIQFGTLDNPSLAAFGLDPGHGGLGDGSEFGIAANQIAFVNLNSGTTGGRLQMGGADYGNFPICFVVPPATFYSPFGENGNGNVYKTSYWNGTAAVAGTVNQSISTMNLQTGNATLTTFDTWTNSIQDNSDPVLSYVPHRQDINTGLGVKNYGATFLDSVMARSAPGGVYYIDLGMAYQAVQLMGPVTISITNVSAITNTAPQTTSAIACDVMFYSPTNNAVAFSPPASVNLIWESELGTAIAPTNIAANTVMHVHALLSVDGGVTNCFLNYKLGSYVPHQ